MNVSQLADLLRQDPKFMENVTRWEVVPPRPARTADFPACLDERLRPALEMRDGKLSVYKKYRGSMQSVYRQYVTERLASAEIRPGHVFVYNSGEVEDETLREINEIVREAVPGAVVHNTLAGCTVASHCGPKTLAVMFIRK